MRETQCKNSLAAIGSSWLVGSSKMRTDGCIAIIEARFKICFCPPETGIDVLKDITFSVNEGEFITVCGPSGCGKSTLLRHLKPDLSPHGVLSGEIFFEEKPISDLSHREQSSKIGFVMQSPENQIVTDKVWHELAF